MKVVVTGAAGKLGGITCRELRAAGYDVTGLDQVADPDRSNPIRMLNLLDASAVKTASAGVEAVVHLANHPTAYGRVAQTVFNENTAMNFNVFEAARLAGVRRVVFASSVQAFRSERRLRDGAPSRLPRLPLDGDIPASPTNPYGLSKMIGEDLLRYFAEDHSMTAVSLRLPSLLPKPPAVADGAPRPDTFLDECFTWLTFADAARCIRAVLATPLKGCRCYFPASPRPSAAGTVE